MLKRLFLVATSAVCLAALATAGLYLLAGGEADVLAATRRTLQTEVATVEAEWRRTGAEVAQMATAMAADASLGTDVRALVTTVEAYNPDAKLAKALGLRIDALRSRLSDRLLQLRHINPEVESIALMSTDGLVLAANSPRWTAGQSVLPSVGGNSPTAPLPEFMLKGLTGSPQSGLWVDKNALWWVSVAPIWAHAPKDGERPTLAGVAVLEQALRSLPASVSATAFLMLDGQPLLGQPPKAMRAWPSTPEPFLLVSRSTQASLFGQTFPLRPFFVEGGHVGVWAQRLHVPGTDRAQGVVTQDLTEAYAAMATRQVQLLAAVCFAWCVLAAMLARRGWHLEHDVNRVADFLLLVTQGSEERKFPETSLGREARRLGLVVNKLLALVPLRGAIATRPVEEPFGPAPTGDLSDPAEALAVVKSFMSGDAVGQATRGRPLLGDLSDTVPRAAAKAPAMPAPSPVRSTPNTTLRADPEEDTGPIARPSPNTTLGAEPEEDTGPIVRPPAFAVAEPRVAASSTPPTPADTPFSEPQSVPPPMLGGSARDQLMAMLQAKAKKPGVRDAGPVRPVAPETVPELHTVATLAVAEADGGALVLTEAVAQADTAASAEVTSAYAMEPGPGVYELDDATDRSADTLPPEPDASSMMEGYEPAANAAIGDAPAYDTPAYETPLEPNLTLDGVPGDAAEPTPVLELAAQPLGLEAEPLAPVQPFAPVEPLPFSVLGGAPAFTPPPDGIGAETPPMAVTHEDAVPLAPPAASDSLDDESPTVVAPLPLELAPPSAPPAEPGPAVVAIPPAAPAVVAPTEDAYRAVYDEFVRLRAQCGDVGELPFDKFVARLQTTRADVLAKHSCQEVQFSAYVKNGKAALKVTPV